MPNHIHSYESKGEVESFLCVFSEDYVSDFTNETKSRSYIASMFDFYDRGEIEALQSNTNRYIKRAVLYSLCGRAMDSGFITWKYKKDRDIELEEKLLLYVQTNYNNEIDLRQAAEQFGYNYTYLSDRFKDIFGVTFTAFVNKFRLEHAAELLRTTDVGVTSICNTVGFKSIRSFNANFKEEYKMSPSEYRLKYRGKNNKI